VEILYGKDDGTQGETEVDWSGWKNTDGSAITTANGVWGEIYIPDGGIVSPVVSFLDSPTLTYSVNYTRYTNTFTPVVYIRSSNTIFSQMDSSPTYALYTTPITVSNQYVQVKLTR
jgi:hypothetical protein